MRTDLSVTKPTVPPRLHLDLHLMQCNLHPRHAVVPDLKPKFASDLGRAEKILFDVLGNLPGEGMAFIYILGCYPQWW
jgi:hypothetical protein